MSHGLDFEAAIKPPLDPGFAPASLWNKAYSALVKKSAKAEKLALALERPNGTVSCFHTEVLPHEGKNIPLNVKYVERILKFLLWMKGGWRVTVGGNPGLAEEIRGIYSPAGARAFDHKIIGGKIYGRDLEVVNRRYEKTPAEKEIKVSLGGNWDGCRIGFDLGGSDRKCAAVIDGKVVHSEEVVWDPYFQKDPEWHKAGINDSLKRAAAKLPRVDAIGGSSAGVYVDNQVRIASLFRGVSENDFKNRVAGMFLELAEEWKVPFIVVNDGEVTALAGAVEMNDNAVLGLSMGTSTAGGYVTPGGNITDWLNELAFVPIDYRDDAPADEWSGDRGCCVQYFSQQGVARLAPLAGFDFPKETPFPERLVEVQNLMKKGDARAAKIYETIGVCFGHAVAHFSEFYEMRNLLILGRVTSGEGGDIILDTAAKTLGREFPDVASKVKFRTPDEKNKRHGQAVMAASLPSLKK